ncbi:MAG TPA: hypothetical protein VFP20_09350 [Bacteroidales bacterium]|nr:hypothetical protein [Bacteroidales bacterium]
MNKLWPNLLLISVLFTACTPVEEVPIANWSQLENFKGTPRASASTFVIGDKAYICCGRTGFKDHFLNEVWQYDSRIDQWSQLDTFPGKPRVKAVAVSINGKGYVGMGSIGHAYANSVFNDFYEFDPVTGNWTSKADFPGTAANDMAYAVIDGCLYTAMGFDGISRRNDSYKYDPSKNEWTRLEDCPGSFSVPAFFSIGKYFYVGSGFQGRNLRLFYRFNTETEKWSSVASLPVGRMMSNGLEIDGKGYVMLGRFWNGVENNGRLLSDIMEYDPDQNNWISRGDFKGAARQNAMVFNIQGRGYVVMGEDESKRLSDVWSFKP